jgi:two-component system sensor histidine kinase KdpD
MNTWIKNFYLALSPPRLAAYAQAVLVVALATGAIYLIGRATLGEGVIALLFLVPISWSTARWGQGAGIVAAVSAALAFNFFFIPPYYTLYIGSLEGWLLLFIFLIVAIVVVGRIQVGLARAQAHEREAIFMYELSAALAGAFNPEAVGRILAGHIQRLYQAAMVRVYIERDGQMMTISEPSRGTMEGKPTRVLPLMAPQGMLGEISVWEGELHLPPADDRLLQNFANQAALALSRAKLIETGIIPAGVILSPGTNS